MTQLEGHHPRVLTVGPAPIPAAPAHLRLRHAHARQRRRRRYHVTIAEVTDAHAGAILPDPHPRGALMSDIGVIRTRSSSAAPGREGERQSHVAAVVTRTLKSQLAQAGFAPEKVTYVAISHARVITRRTLIHCWFDVADPAGGHVSWDQDDPRIIQTFYTALPNSKPSSSTRTSTTSSATAPVIIDGAGRTPGHRS